MKYCLRCGTGLSNDAAFCVACGSLVGRQNQNPQYSQPRNYRQPPYQNGYQQSPHHNPYQNQNPHYNPYQNPGYIPNQPPRQPAPGLFDRLTDAVNRAAGGEGAVYPPLREIFSETFAKHTKEEAERIFISGTSDTTPRLTSADTLWPKPWLYARILLAFAAAFLMMHICCVSFDNLNAYPGAIMLGSFMVPVAVMIFFFELNTPKNISFYTMLKVFMVGGCASLLFTLFLGELFPVEQLDYSGAIVTGIVEELGKLGIVAWFLHQEKNAKYNVNGLLIGAAVGAGFAAFESAGYAFRFLLGTGYDGMMEVLFVRAILAPGGHVVWAAMSGYGIMLVRKYTGSAPMGFLNQAGFWKIFLMPVAMHSVWDMPIPFGQEYYFVQILMLVLSWIVIFVLINNSLAQLGRVLRNETSIHFVN